MQFLSMHKKRDALFDCMKPSRKTKKQIRPVILGKANVVIKYFESGSKRETSHFVIRIRKKQTKEVNGGSLRPVLLVTPLALKS